MKYFSYHVVLFYLFFFFFNDTATTEIYTLSLHDALPTSRSAPGRRGWSNWSRPSRRWPTAASARSEEHTSELQSHSDLVCRLLLEKKTTHTLPSDSTTQITATA